MKAFPHFTLLIFILSTIVVKAQFQNTQYNYRVEITEHHQIYQVVKDPKADTVNIPKGAITTYEKKYRIKNQDYSVMISDTEKVGRVIYASKEISFPVILPGIATITVDKSDKSKLFVNYYLIAKRLFKAGTQAKIDINDRKIDSIFLKDTYLPVLDLNVELYKYHRSYQEQLRLKNEELSQYIKNEVLNPQKNDVQNLNRIAHQIDSIKSNDSYYMRFENAKMKLFQLNNNGDTTAIYYSQFSDAPYFIKLKNREFVKFTYKAWESGALTIPFKYRPRSRKNRVAIPDDLTVDLSVGAYFGYAIGSIIYSFRENEDIEPIKKQLSIGPFLSVSRVEIDSNSTITSKSPLTEKRAIATFSPGLGAMFSISNTRIGVFVGTDIGAGQTASKWDYHGKIWLGFGVGYNIGMFWKTSK